MKRALFVFAILAALLTGCASKEDKAIAQEVIAQIENIESITIENANKIYDVYKLYCNLTESQQKLVSNGSDLLKMVSMLENLIIEDKISNDPTNTVTKSDLTGIWQAEGNYIGSHRSYFFFTSKGYVYYLSSKDPVSQRTFTDKFLVGTSYSLGNYSVSTFSKNGGFYNIATNADATYSLRKDAKGNLTLKMNCGVASGTYTKTNENVSTSPEPCLHPGCSAFAVNTGDSVYCELHSNRCLECHNYVDEDALFCLNCIVEALKNS